MKVTMERTRESSLYMIGLFIDNMALVTQEDRVTWATKLYHMIRTKTRISYHIADPISGTKIPKGRQA